MTVQCVSCFRNREINGIIRDVMYLESIFLIVIGVTLTIIGDYVGLLIAGVSVTFYYALVKGEAEYKRRSA